MRMGADTFSGLLPGGSLPNVLLQETKVWQKFSRWLSWGCVSGLSFHLFCAFPFFLFYFKFLYLPASIVFLFHALILFVCNVYFAC